MTMMRKVLLITMTLLLTSLTAFADVTNISTNAKNPSGISTRNEELPDAPFPEYTIEVTEDYVYVFVTGEGEVTLFVNSYYDGYVEVEIPYCLERTESGYYVELIAGMHMEGYNDSYVSFYVDVPAKELVQLPAPEIYRNLENSVFSIHVVGEGDLHLLVFGQEIEGTTYSTTLQQDLEYEIECEAYATGEGHLESEHVTATFTVPMEFHGPYLYKNIDDDYVSIMIETEADMTIYIDGEEDTEWDNVGNYTNGFPRLYDDYVVTITVLAHMTGHKDVEKTFEIEVPALDVIPTEMTAPPSYSYTVMPTGAVIIELTNTPGEEAAIFLRWKYSGDDYSDWFLYDGSFCFDVPGIYEVEAYAIADGKLESEHISFVFIVQELGVEDYDFEEDGIYYKITASGKVSVSSKDNDYNDYSGIVSIPNTVTHDGVTYMVTGIRDYAFCDCKDLTAVTIGGYVTSIGYKAFEGCSALTKVVISDYVMAIGDRAFNGCSAMKSVTLGYGVKSIGNSAFAGCPALTDVICKPATPPVMASYGSFECYDTATLHVYPPVLDSYASDRYWNRFTSIVGESTVAPATGDINGDGQLTISDVTSLISRILKGN